jgi:hypothetical protein
MKGLLLIPLWLHSLIVCGQVNAHLEFVPQWQESPIPKDVFFFIGNTSDSLRISSLRIYLHTIQLESEGRVVWSSGKEHCLVDVFEKDQAEIAMPKSELSKCDYISFVIGVDSTLQTTGAHSGALDPIHGMYWTWQSGYIGWKFEGEELSAGQSTAIQWHVGGFRAPYQTQRTVRLKIGEVGDSIQCSIQIDRLLHDWRSIVPAEVMSPNYYARLLADRFQTCFQIKLR